MKVELLHKEKKEIVLGVKDEGHTFLNILRATLSRQPDVTGAAYRIEHPLVGFPELIVTTEKKPPQEALTAAAADIAKTAGEFRTAFEKGLRA